MGEQKSKVEALRNDLDSAEESGGEAESVTDRFLLSSKRRDLRAASAVYDELQKRRKELDDTIVEMRKQDNTPSDMYFSPFDRRVLDWHWANLEFANATSLYNLSIKNWDQDDDFEFSGSHLTIADGMCAVPRCLSEGLTMEFKVPVKNVKQTESGVEVTVKTEAESGGEAGEKVYKADVCLCTIPLGVLKKSLEEPKEAGTLAFEPPLPEWKTAAVRRMGFGNLNKVVLCFDRVFWDTTTNMFGHVNRDPKAKGELFLFWSIYQPKAVLLALVAGDAAEIHEQVADNIIVGRCVRVLSEIFKIQAPTPVESVVTRWRADPFARGSYSYVGLEGSGNDYDVLAAPVALESESGERKAQPRLFFAGEHTTRNYPATVHGAIISGFREAGRIADQFLHCPYAPSSREERD